MRYWDNRLGTPATAKAHYGSDLGLQGRLSRLTAIHLTGDHALAGTGPTMLSTAMKAIVYHRYGPPDVVALAEVPKPTPKDNEVLIRIYATTVTTGDWRARSLHPARRVRVHGPSRLWGLRTAEQSILGTELSGIVEAVGKAVKQFKVATRCLLSRRALWLPRGIRAMAEDGLIAHQAPRTFRLKKPRPSRSAGRTTLNSCATRPVSKGRPGYSSSALPVASAPRRSRSPGTSAPK